MATRPAEQTPNPFEVTKATDLNDAQIAATWVDLPSGGGFRSLIDPTSPVSRFVLGGKGSGRTHVMRYFSSSLQAMRVREHGPTTLFDDRYVGVYVNSSTLNPGRFSGKGQNDDTWKAVFSYYLDLWLSLRIILAVEELCAARGHGEFISDAVTEEIHRLLDGAPKPASTLAEDFRRILREMDVSINEAAVTRELRVAIRSSADHLVFSTARALNRVEAFSGFQFALLLDEFENFSELQQRCTNTLIREKTPGVSFVVGARTFGVRTYQTIGGEDNVEGSEFETVMLDSLHRKERGAYERFCRDLVTRRLARARLFVGGSQNDVKSTLRAHFVDFSRATVGKGETAFVRDHSIDGRRCLANLREQLREHRPFSVGDDAIDQVIRLLHCAEDPLSEKVAVYLFYRAWHGGQDPLKAATAIRADASTAGTGNEKTLFATTVGHFRGDMLAQLLSEYKQKQRYLGFSECVALSGGLPRALLVVLKNTYRWAVFNGERPFTAGHAISEESQRAGVREAAHWFLADLPSIGPNGAAARSAIDRLGRFLKALRFSDKPTESSACTVSLNGNRLADSVVSIVDHCIEFSFLLPIFQGHSDRNTGERNRKLQLHPILCPLWNLPTGRRGVVELSASEATAIFGEDMPERYGAVTRTRLARMNVPFQAPAGAGGLGLDFK